MHPTLHAGVRGRSFPRAAAVLLAALLAACAPAMRSAPAPGSPTPSRLALSAALDSVFADTALAHAHWGVLVRSLDTGETLYRQNPAKTFLPASNMKLVTGAMALEALGPEFRFRTRVLAAGPVRDGALRGDLVVVGGGDPTISARFGGDDARAVLRSWADSLRAHGVTRIEGAIVAIDTAFDRRLAGRGWAWDDLDAAYAAEVSGLEFNEGTLQVRVFPAERVGAPGIVVLDPPTGYAPIVNRTVTVAPGAAARLDVERDLTGPAVVVTGQVPADTSLRASVAVRDPTRYFVAVLRETLREAGVAVDGPALVPGDRDEELGTPAATTPLFTFHSPPLREILPAMMKPSQNQIAEILLKTLGRELRREGSAAAGEAAIDSLLRTRGIDPRALVMADGSGLSRYDLVTPELLVELLAMMTRSPSWELWYSALPVAGVDGTLERRLVGTAGEGRVHAKTGTLTGVRALSGYLTTAGGERLAFSMLVNHHLLSSRDADRVVDAALLRIIAEGGR